MQWYIVQGAGLRACWFYFLISRKHYTTAGIFGGIAVGCAVQTSLRAVSGSSHGWWLWIVAVLIGTVLAIIQYYAKTDKKGAAAAANADALNYLMLTFLSTAVLFALTYVK